MSTEVKGFRAQDEIFAKTARTRAEKDRIHQSAVQNAMKGAFIGSLIGIAANAALVRYSPRWASWHLVPRTIICISPAIIGFVTQGEHAALEIEREMGRAKSIVNVDQPDVDVREKVSMSDIKDYVLQNRFKVVGVTWATVVGATLLSVYSNKSMPAAQKLITARMYAQGTALAAFVGFAAAASTPVDKSSVVDRLSERHYSNVMSQESQEYVHHHVVSEEERAAMKAKLEKLKEERAAHRAQHQKMATVPNMSESH